MGLLLFVSISIGFGGLFGKISQCAWDSLTVLRTICSTPLMHCSHTICPTYAVLHNQQLLCRPVFALTWSCQSSLCFGQTWSFGCRAPAYGAAGPHDSTADGQPHTGLHPGTLYVLHLSTCAPSCLISCLFSAPLFLSGDSRTMTDRRAGRVE